MGEVLSAERRGALAEWARQRDGWILEDDYDAEFRYDREPVGAVQGRYRERRDALVDAVAAAGLDLRLEGVAAGMQAVLRLEDEVDDEALVRALAARGVEVAALSRYAIRSPARGLVIGFGQPTPAALRTAADVIADMVRRPTTAPASSPRPARGPR
ncbi:hypothetical protein BH23ACT9_BH23ACT9_20150 [soil metagenome]